MILAAGKGTRVRPITHTIPKPLIPILQKPVMEFLLELLRQHGFTQVMVNVSHLAEEIESYFRDGQRFGVEIGYSFEGRIVDGELVGDALGSAGGLRKIQDFNPFFDDTLAEQICCPVPHFAFYQMPFWYSPFPLKCLLR